MLFDLAIHLFAGVSFALAGMKLHDTQRGLRSTALWTTVGFFSLFVAPVMLVLMHRNPEWFFLYLAEIERFTPRLAVSQLAVFAAGMAAFLGARAVLVRRKRRVTQLALLVLSGAVSVLLVMLGWSREAVVGRTSEVIAEQGTRPLAEATEGYLLAGALAVIAVGWVLTTWHLFRYARAAPIAARYVGAVPVRDGHTQALPGRAQPEDEGAESKAAAKKKSPAKKAGTKKAPEKKPAKKKKAQA